MRQPIEHGPAFRLGGDGLGRRRPEFDPSRRTFTCVCWVDPRKGQTQILDASERLWAAGRRFNLHFVGGVTAPGEPIAARIKAMGGAGFPVRHDASPPDSVVRDAMLSARAMIYPSIHEGYGIPPLEALALGVPVVVTASTPSLEGLSEAGQLRIDPPTVDAVADAMERFLDDDFAARKTAEIEGFEVPTWKGMAEEVARWVAGEWSEDEGGTWSSGPRASAIAGANRRTAGA